MSELAAFLLARIADDEATARACISREPGFSNGPRGGHWSVVDLDEGTPRAGRFGHVATAGMTITAWPDHAAHIARHDPARVLAECEAKRRIVALYVRLRRDVYADEWDRGRATGLREAMLALAQPFADHPDFRDEWRLDAPERTEP